MGRCLICLFVVVMFPMVGLSQYVGTGPASPNDTVTVTSWSLVLEARMSGLHDSSATCGVRPDATPDFDSKYDRPCPPNPPGDWLQVFFPHTGGHWPTLLGTRFSEDITSPDTGIWTMNVESSLDTGRLTLSWDTSLIHRLPVGYTILLKDADAPDTVDMRSHPSYQFHYSGLRVFSIWVVFDAVTLPMGQGWNLMSLPRIVTDSSKFDLFPSAASSAFAYDGGYVPRTFLQAGYGFWLKFDAPQNAYIAGKSFLVDTFDLKAGWNIIGSLSKSCPVSSIASIPPAEVTSSFFAYAGSYFVATTIDPGMGYWVRVAQNCKLILSASGATSPESRIRISATADRPPSPPGHENSDAGNDLPRNVALYQNYPNPFNPSTIIRYALPEQAFVRLVLANILGQEVAVLVDGSEGAGYHQVEVNESTFSLSSGFYFYRLSVTGSLTGEKYDLVKKLILMK
jgi:hypothetical protein